MGKYKNIVPVIFLTLLLVSCNQAKKPDYSNKNFTEVKAKNDSENKHRGKKLMETKCYVCHNPSADQGSRIAPPMVAIKSHYLNDKTTKEEFVNDVWSFVKKPSKDKTKMRGAVKRFGVMPYQSYLEDDIKLISEYMYDYKIEEPKWFKAHIKKESKGKIQYRNNGKIGDNSTSIKKKTTADRGLEYALNTKKELGKNLMGTIQKKGTLKAVTFCNKKAYPITDSMAVAQNASIRRVSDKPRNQNNQANSKELAIIANYKKAIANNQEYQPITNVEKGEVKFYAPIITNSMCLQCHGVVGKDVVSDVSSAISSLYPDDKALGYKASEVRGIWSITFQE